jgi:hypothetical protein
VEIYRTPSQLGLLEDDDIDALALDVNFNNDGVVEALFSLAPNSPSLIAGGFSAADVFYTKFDGTFQLAGPANINFPFVLTANNLGLLDNDNLDAFDIVYTSTVLKIPQNPNFPLDIPLAVELIDFTLTANERNQVTVEWETASETDNLGMNVWCAKLGYHFENFTKLNGNEKISSNASPPDGAFYSSENYPWKDTELEPGIQHCTLEDIDTRGKCNLHCDFIKTVVIDNHAESQQIDLKDINARAIELCNEYQTTLEETGQKGLCLDEVLH